MTIQEWLLKHDVSVEFYIRGFRFESPYGAVHQQVLFTTKMPKSFVTIRDVVVWLHDHPEYVSDDALGELREILA